MYTIESGCFLKYMLLHSHLHRCLVLSQKDVQCASVMAICGRLISYRHNEVAQSVSGGRTYKYVSHVSRTYLR